jgi:nicotinic acid mononucleotide adenylyltransferase
MEKTTTIIYGGAFNPPTLAHKAILEACAKVAKRHNGEVWVMPSGDRTDKEIPVSRDTRMTYIDALIRDIDARDIPITVTTIELDGIARSGLYSNDE